MGTTRRKFSTEFKKKVVLEALRERNTTQLAQEFWKIALNLFESVTP